jgi:magnesium-transporting ATPase (P-type)
LRNSELILYFFYKNFIFTLPQVYYSFHNGFSGQTCFDDWNISFYNMFFTALPLMCRALLEQDINADLDGKDFKQYIPSLFYIG